MAHRPFRRVRVPRSPRDGAARRARTALAVVTLAATVAAAAMAAGCGGGGDSSSSTGTAPSTVSSTPPPAGGSTVPFVYPEDIAGESAPFPRQYVCKDVGKTYPYAKAPLLGSPPAGYLAPLFKAVQGKGIVVSGEFGHSATSTPSMTLASNAADVDSINDAEIVPDPGSVNPWTEGTKVFAPNRSYHLLFIPQPDGPFDMSTLAPSLKQIPNVMTEPVGDGTWFFQNRGYYAFNGYDNYGWGGPTRSIYPSIFQVDLATGAIEPCSTQVSVGLLSFYPEDALTPTVCVGCPASPFTKPYAYQSPTYYSKGFGRTTLGPNEQFAKPLPDDGSPDVAERIAEGIAQAAKGPGAGDGAAPATNTGIVFPPPVSAKNAQGATIPDQVIYFYRPSGTVPGMNVAQNSDNCATNAGAALDPANAAIIRVPVAPTTFNVRSLTRDSVFSQPQERLYTLGIYGRRLVRYRLGTDSNFYLGNMDIRLDDGHGATFLVYPSGATPQEVATYATLAQQNGWNLLAGNEPVTTGKKGTLVSDTALFRIRNAKDGYYGALYPSKSDPTAGAPCYADDPAYGTDYPLQKVPPQFRITPKTMGAAAMLGVVCDRQAALTASGLESCVSSLKQAFEAEGGSYTASG